MQRKSLIVVLAAALCAATAMLTSAGPLNPPPGAVSPTGRTLDDIFNAIGALPADDCGTRIPGRSRGTGLLTVEAPQGPLPPIQIESYRLNIEMPYDPGSGLPTGQVRYMPLVVMKETDQTSPLLAQVMVLNQTLPQVKLRLRDSRGADYFEITLENARVTTISSGMVPLCGGMQAHLEEVSFQYNRITWEDLATGVIFTADRGP